MQINAKSKMPFNVRRLSQISLRKGKVNEGGSFMS